MRPDLSSTGYESASSVAAQSDGKLVVGAAAAIAGRTTAYDFAILRLNADGSRDATFGETGVVITDVARTSDWPLAIAVDRVNRIVVAGGARSAPPTIDRFALVRYMPKGQLDPTFGTGGRVTTEIGTDSEARGLALQPDGKLVVAGTTGCSQACGFAVARYNENGSLDSTFGTNGVAVANGVRAFASAVAVQEDGRIVVAGGDAVAEFTAAGALDTSFGDQGFARLAAAAGMSQAGAVIAQENRKLVIVGSGDPFGVVVVRLNSDGERDQRFGSNGIQTAHFGTNTVDAVWAGAIQPDGKILAAGHTSPSPGNGPYDIAVARFLPPVCVVPNVRGLTLAAARGRLAAANCVLGSVSTAYSTKVKKGRVVTQTPAAAARLPEQAEVRVVVSRGPKPKPRRGR